jgi:hypothetical protein
MVETGASMFTVGELAYARAVREEAETARGPAFTLLPYFWSLMMRAVTSEYYLPGATVRLDRLIGALPLPAR